MMKGKYLIKMSKCISHLLCEFIEPNLRVYTFRACLLDEFNDCTHTGCVNSRGSASLISFRELENKIIKYTLLAFTNSRASSKYIHLVMSHFIIVNPETPQKNLPTYFASVTEMI